MRSLLAASRRLLLGPLVDAVGGPPAGEVSHHGQEGLQCHKELREGRAGQERRACQREPCLQASATARRPLLAARPGRGLRAAPAYRMFECSNVHPPTCSSGALKNRCQVQAHMADPRQGSMPHAMPFQRGLPLTSPYRHLHRAVQREERHQQRQRFGKGVVCQANAHGTAWELPANGSRLKSTRQRSSSRGHAPFPVCAPHPTHMSPIAVIHSTTEEVCTAQVGKLRALAGSGWMSNASAGPAAASSSTAPAAAAVALLLLLLPLLLAVDNASAVCGTSASLLLAALLASCRCFCPPAAERAAAGTAACRRRLHGPKVSAAHPAGARGAARHQGPRRLAF